MIGLLRKPETITLAILLIAFGISAAATPQFRDAEYLFDRSSEYMEIGLLALAMTFVIISGNIDLSVASGLALVACVMGRLAMRGCPMGWILLTAVALGLILGLFNGLLITKLKLPSLTVTLGTLALYRGIAQILLGDESSSDFPEWFLGLDYRKVRELVPYPLIVFLCFAIIMAVILHMTVFGRCVYAIGTNERASRFSGIRVERTKLIVFMLSGLMMGLGAIMMVSRLGVARHDLATGNELVVITAVVLGGADIFGGRGSILGTVLALLLLCVVQIGMGLREFRPETKLLVQGALLVAAVLLTNLTGRLGTRLTKKTAKGETLDATTT